MSASRRLRHVLPVAGLIALVWLNAYLIRELFTNRGVAKMNSMQGFWAAMARWGGSAWWTPTWWPFWDAGMPFEYTYAPLVPGLAALVSSVGQITELHAVQMIGGAVFCGGPALLYLALWRMGRSAGWAFSAAVAYSLTSLALLPVPDGPFVLASGWRPQRFDLIVTWDETPHMLALALLPVAVLALIRMIETRRLAWIAGGTLVMAAMVYASAFGATLLAISALCVLASVEAGLWAWAVVALAGTLTWLASSVAMPPSLIGVIRAAADTHGHGWSAGSWTALAFTALCWALTVPLVRRRVREPWMRFFLLFTLTSLVIAGLYQYTERQFLPQPGRYKLELSLGLAVCATLLLRAWWGRASWPVQATLIALGLALAGERVVEHRRWAKDSLRTPPLEQTIEFRAARWMDAHLDPGARVFLPGSMSQWLNTFSPRPQWTGSSWATAENQVRQRAQEAVYSETGGIEGTVTWLQAYGVRAVMTSGPGSPEFWKPYAEPGRFEGRLEKLWSEDDTHLYRLPARWESLAHAVPETARPDTHWPRLQGYVAALGVERAPGLTFAWEGPNRAVARGLVRAGEAVSVQISHHPGWSVRANGRAVPTERDGIGLMWIRPGCAGNCTLELEYSGGGELIVCRVLSTVTLLSLVVAFGWALWRGREMKKPAVRRAFVI